MNWEKHTEGNRSELCSPNTDALQDSLRKDAPMPLPSSPLIFCSPRFNKVNTAWIKFLCTFWFTSPFLEHKSFGSLLRKDELNEPLLS